MNSVWTLNFIIIIISIIIIIIISRDKMIKYKFHLIDYFEMLI